MLYTNDPSKEFRDFEAGRVPAHRVFGAAELPGIGVDVAFCRWHRVPERLRRRQLWKLWQAGWVFVHQRKFAAIVATTEAAALPLLLLRLLGLLRRPLVVLSVAVLTDQYLSGAGGAVRRFLLRGADMVTAYARDQLPALERQIGLNAE